MSMEHLLREETAGRGTVLSIGVKVEGKYLCYFLRR